jgi:hypothetical protein
MTLPQTSRIAIEGYSSPSAQGHEVKVGENPSLHVKSIKYDNTKPLPQIDGPSPRIDDDINLRMTLFWEIIDQLLTY